jgi:pimeloyl-ACP methyl ester carboxylesterase
MMRATSRLRTTIVTACVAAFATFASCASLDSFLYSPKRTDHYLLPDPDGWPADRHVPDDLRDLVQFEATLGDSHFTVYGAFARRPAGEMATAPTVIYNHGNADNIDYYWNRVSLLWSLGANVLVYDYPGYGRTPGTPTEEGVYAAGRAAMGYIRGLTTIDQSKVYIYGWSLGGGAAMEMAVENHSAGLIIESTFASVAALTADGSMLVPRSFLMTNVFDNLSKVRRAAHNTRFGVLFFHGEADDFVQTKYGQQLDAQVASDTQPPPHRLILVPGATHSNVPFVADMQSDPAHQYSVNVQRFLTTGALEPSP